MLSHLYTVVECKAYISSEINLLVGACYSRRRVSHRRFFVPSTKCKILDEISPEKETRLSKYKIMFTDITEKLKLINRKLTY